MTNDVTTPDEPAAGVSDRGSPVSGRVVAIVIVVAVVVAAVVGRAWFDVGGSRPLPGTALAIQTDLPSAAGATCPASAIPPARLAVRGASLVLLGASDGADIPVVWPAGYAARLDLGRGGLYDAAGYLVAAAGETIQGRFFGALGGDGAVHVCRVARD